MKITHMTEEKIKQIVCPQLSAGKGELVNCLGRGCVAFTVTATHQGVEVTVIADREKADSVPNGEKLILDGSSHGLFVGSNLEWRDEVHYEDGRYSFMGSSSERGVNDSGHIAKYKASLPIKTENGALSCFGYCHLNMKSDRGFFDA